MNEPPLSISYVIHFSGIIVMLFALKFFSTCFSYVSNYLITMDWWIFRMLNLFSIQPLVIEILFTFDIVFSYELHMRWSISWIVLIMLSLVSCLDIYYKFLFIFKSLMLTKVLTNPSTLGILYMIKSLYFHKLQIDSILDIVKVFQLLTWYVMIGCIFQNHLHTLYSDICIKDNEFCPFQ